MKSRLIVLLQVFLWVICAFHIIVGVGLNVSPAFPQVVAGYYGAEVSWTPEFVYIVKPIGAFMIALGVMAGAAARDPVGHRSIVYGFAVLFAIRGLQRLVFQGEIETALSIGASRNFGNALLFLVMAAALVALYKLAGKRAD